MLNVMRGEIVKLFNVKADGSELNEYTAARFDMNFHVLVFSRKSVLACKCENTQAAKHPTESFLTSRLTNCDECED